MIPIRERKSFVIERSKWARETSEGTFPCGESHLLNSEGAMCCLGHWMKKIWDMPDAHLRHSGTPSILWGHDLVHGRLGILRQSKLIGLNDRSSLDSTHPEISMSDEDQERLIQGEFEKAGYEVTFVD